MLTSDPSFHVDSIDASTFTDGHHRRVDAQLGLGGNSALLFYTVFVSIAFAMMTGGYEYAGTISPQTPMDGIITAASLFFLPLNLVSNNMASLHLLAGLLKQPFSDITTRQNRTKSDTNS
jgi:hypothetical protein